MLSVDRQITDLVQALTFVSAEAAACRHIRHQSSVLIRRNVLTNLSTTTRLIHVDETAIASSGTQPMEDGLHGPGEQVSKSHKLVTSRFTDFVKSEEPRP